MFLHADNDDSDQQAQANLRLRWRPLDCTFSSVAAQLYIMGFMVTVGTRQGENPVYGNFCNYGFLRCVQNDFVLKETGENVYAGQNIEFVLLFR